MLYRLVKPRNRKVGSVMFDREQMSLLWKDFTSDITVCLDYDTKKKINMSWTLEHRLIQLQIYFYS